MDLIAGFTDSPRQSSTIPLEDGSTVVLDLEFRDQQRGWFYDLSYKTFSLLGQRLVYGENILRQFRGQLPFGLAVLTKAHLDPASLSSLVSADTAIVLLNQEDVALIETANFTRDD